MFVNIVLLSVSSILKFGRFYENVTGFLNSNTPNLCYEGALKENLVSICCSAIQEDCSMK